MEYDASRLANFGRDTARAYASFLRSEKKLCDEVNAAVTNGTKPLKIAHDIMGRCGTQEERLNLLSALIALAKLEKIPQSVVEPFEEGIRAKRL